MQVHLVDGTYELFRYFHALPPHSASDGQDVAAVQGVLTSVLALISDGATHVAVATDHVIESFRNDMWPGYKSSLGVPEVLLAQFGLLEEALVAMGVTVWPMTDLEADDALASGAAVAADTPDVGTAVVCTPDKDLAQCVREDGRVIQLDRRRDTLLDAAAVRAKFGVDPASIPDWLALVGDTADGFPGLPGWGTKSAAAVLMRYKHLEAIPALAIRWDVAVRGGTKLAATLAAQMDDALLFRDIATLRTSADVGAVEEWRWTGPRPGFAAMCERLRAGRLVRRAEGLAP